MTSRRRGVALLEALCAIMVLTVAGTSLVHLMAGQAAAVRSMARSSAALETQQRVLGALSLLTRRELESMVPSREVGEFTVEVDRMPGDVFIVTVTPSGPWGSVISTFLAPPVE